MGQTTQDIEAVTDALKQSFDGMVAKSKSLQEQIDAASSNVKKQYYKKKLTKNNEKIMKVLIRMELNSMKKSSLGD